MALSLTMDFYQRIEAKFGKELALDVAKVLEETSVSFEQQAQALALQKKIEVRDELTKELASKTDVALAKTELMGEIKTLEARIDARFEKQQRMFVVMFFCLLFTTVFVNKETLVFLLRVLGIVK